MQAVSSEEIRSEVKKLIAEVTEREPEEITDTALFADELGVDSLMAMEVMVAVDKKYKINIPEDEFAKIKNVDDTVAVVRRVYVRGQAGERRGLGIDAKSCHHGVGLVTPIGAGRICSGRTSRPEQTASDPWSRSTLPRFRCTSARR